ncbi:MULTISPECIES: large-conductance mechanosensitive channel protein MscL [Acetobacter]|uniref:Large-conductance mechanosensitive channel n=1 Tax=Acetobacter thailandicus TaxID=1502842 RepID=A0ABT3QFH9_9PROT|nr:MULTISPECIES: large-conductance mechanosensitive channel protein MscL [Acetobacter]MBS0959499.1 large-conductance mechanosensitive channel protein MscL [Acetobacter thailandicus]MBS0981065.1 large-conductance mechanosensitive channel protein MscL [Acetobacter thailandicus]MBS0985345.1 large-conductance mechanosensitive channel protein MscL [Acetobacter thailandicus]MBS1002630.1 large-conductance mechanosensitive channel protein MscL [Acetobacter thailandicus]MCX2564046.1 large-conductance m
MAESKLKVHTPGWVSEFRAFIMRGSVVDLAVGVIVGAAFTGVVNSLVKDVFNPVIGLIIGGIDFSNVFITLKGPHVTSLAEAQKVGAVTINLGMFLNAIIQFLITAMVIFWVIKALTKMHVREDAKPAAPPAPTKTEILLEQIRDELASKRAE